MMQTILESVALAHCPPTTIRSLSRAVSHLLENQALDCLAEVTYLLGRAAAELSLAVHADHPKAREAHGGLAAAYQDRAAQFVLSAYAAIDAFGNEAFGPDVAAPLMADASYSGRYGR